MSGAAWTDLLALTESMLDAARTEDFDRVAVLEDERRDLIARLPGADAALRPLLERIADLDRVLIARVAAARSDAAELLRHVRQVQAGAGAYLGVAFGR